MDLPYVRLKTVISIFYDPQLPPLAPNIFSCFAYEMKNIDNTMTILHKENNKLEEREVLKEAASLIILNDVINGRNDPLYKILLPVDS